MISPHTEISLFPLGVQFVTPTSQGAQLVKITMLLREPVIYAAAVTLNDKKLSFEPMALSLVEIEEFFAVAKSKWKGK